MLFVDIEARDHVPMATSRGLAFLPDTNEGIKDWLRILYPDLASQSAFDLSVSCVGRELVPGEPMPEDLASITVHVDLPSSTFGALAGADPTMNPQSCRSSQLSTKRPSESTTPTSVKKTKSSEVDPDEVNQALQAAVGPPPRRPTVRDHRKDRETFQRALGTAAMIRDQTTYIDQFPDEKTFRRHFQEAVRRRFKAAGTPDTDAGGDNARTNDDLQHEEDSEIDSDPDDFMFTKAAPLRTDGNLTIRDLEHPGI
ncbi:hypothetical protein HDU86_001854 [Geranomyces michiganensis]|nr:hypothetical protein HDU86_001854 [Geranomyces michiganensis]